MRQKFGNWKIVCKDSDQIYAEQTKRSIDTKYKKHVGSPFLVSVVAQHLVKSGHHIELSSLEVHTYIGRDVITLVNKNVMNFEIR